MNETLLRACRIALLGEIIASFPDTHERVDFIMRLKAGDAITGATADLLLETYVRERVG